jgi:uncharacterized protein (DUF433 family)
MGGEIVRDGGTGQAIVAATGTPVDHILEALESGDSRDDVLRAHPGLTLDDLVAAVRFARAAVERGVQYSMPRPQPLVAREHAVAYGPSASLSSLRSYADVHTALRSAERERKRLAYRLDLVESVHDGLGQAAAGDVIPHDEVFAHLGARFPG